MTDNKWMLLPPAFDKCQMCAMLHQSHEPHNKMSMYYQVRFKMAHDREPTWADAVAHCDNDTKETWEAALRDLDKWSSHPNPIVEID